MTKTVEIDVYIEKCVYLNDRRIAGGKPYPMHEYQTTTFKAKTEDILNALDFEDVAKYVDKKRGSND